VEKKKKIQNTKDAENTEGGGIEDLTAKGAKDAKDAKKTSLRAGKRGIPVGAKRPDDEPSIERFVAPVASPSGFE